jgi:mono/diheme cytochrome c family protein
MALGRAVGRVATGLSLGFVLATVLAVPRARAGSWESLVADGERWWSRAPDPGQPVACATCHHDPEAVRGWAASFPKVRPLPPPHARVMTLLQATAEAVTRHYRPVDPRPAAIAISAFLTARGVGLPITPGLAPGEPRFPARLRALADSVERGRRLYGRRCASCHVSTALAPWEGFVARTPAELFLEGHRPAGRPLPWNSPAMADLLAYLVAQRVGQPVAAGGRLDALEVSR